MKDLTINLGFNKRSQLKLKAIAKHAGVMAKELEALADELESIDNAIECPHCGSLDVITYMTDNKGYQRQCTQCNETFDTKE
ncbi:hypothetical protein [Rummeliibacillus stabekisii]|uniref:Uncharacterized protein n=1 Tax=Rummeliibacillus stabekisii TaxID=241244 RepID=A0A143HCL4_9BACL|nr:hypothetical protein [Rummeliibacillus stabekisii]AMW98440.1 hypothetical protein ATY39_02725 [Rummeliibacillus stabekisii]AMW99216.1 hypothetical protein ATY39_06905 [Rummeliibacillus stabekisii]